MNADKGLRGHAWSDRGYWSFGPHARIRLSPRLMTLLVEMCEQAEQKGSAQCSSASLKKAKRGAHSPTDVDLPSLLAPIVVGSLVVATILTACGPSIDPAAKADVDARIAKLADQAITIPAPQPGTVAPMPLATGQWAQYRVRLKDGEQLLRTTKILEKEGNAFWYEVVEDTYRGRTVERILVSFGDETQHPHVELLALKSKDAKGRIGQVSRRQLALPIVTYDTYRAQFTAFIAPWPPRPEGPTVVPAGRFEGCSHETSAIKLRRHERVIESWWHPAVPLSGFVRLQDSSGAVENELVAYGTTGARSEF